MISNKSNDRNAPSHCRGKWPISTMIVAAVGVVLSVLIFCRLHWVEGQQLRDRFEVLSKQRAIMVESTIYDEILVLQGIQSLFESSIEVDRGEFATGTAPYLKHGNSHQLYGWVPKLNQKEEVARYERLAREDGMENFQVFPCESESHLAETDDYFPMYYVEPFVGNEGELGRDLSKDPACAEAMKEAVERNRPAITTYTLYGQESEPLSMFAVFMPIYQRDGLVYSAKERWKNLEGFLVGVFRYGTMLKESLTLLDPEDIDVDISQVDSSGREVLLCSHLCNIPKTNVAQIRPIQPNSQSSLTWESDLKFLGDHWRIRCRSTPEFAKEHFSSLPGWALGGGLLITLFLTTWVHSLAGQTERVQSLVEQRTVELRESEEQFRMLFEGMRSGVAVFEAVDNGDDFVFKDFNRAAEETESVRREDLIGRRVTEAFPGVVSMGFLDVLQRVWRTGTAEFQPESIYRDDRDAGSWRESWTYKLPSGDVVTVYDDVTDRKRAEEALKDKNTELDASYSRIREITDTITDILWSYQVDDTGKVVGKSISAQADAILELPNGTIGDSFEKYFSYIQPDDFSEVMTVLEQAIVNPGKVMEAEYRLALTDGTMKWVHSRGVASILPDGTVKACGRTTDITERKQAEAALAQSFKDLEAFNRAMIGREERIIELKNQANALAVELGRQPIYKLGLEEVVSISFKEFSAYELEDLPSDMSPDDASELQRSRRAAASLLEDANLARQRSEEHVAALKRANQKLDEYSRRAEAATKAKSEFLANMSHEIRTPMTAILGFAEMLGDEEDLEDSSSPRQEAICTIQRSGHYLLELINGVLDLSKIEAGRLELERLPCWPARIVHEVASIMRVQADTKNLSLEVEFGGAIPSQIETDPTRLKQILVNLVGNAVKFTETGSVRVLSRFLPAEEGTPHIQFDVIDTGIGMPEERLANLFQPFTQIDSSSTRRFGGTGLGLTISKRLAEALGGDISVVSSLGEGSTFTVTIETGSIEGVDFIENADRAEPHAEPQLLMKESQPLQLDGRILLVEDGPDNQRLIRFLLEKAGAEVTVSDNGQLGCESAQEASTRGEPYDCILMDMQMPVMDGYSATRAIRADGYSGPIIALTAHAMDSDEAKCRAAGCDAYLTKPIARAVLLATISRCLRSQRESKQ